MQWQKQVEWNSESGSAPKGAATKFELAATPAVFKAKTRAFFTSHREAREAKARKYRAMSGPLIGVGVVASVIAVGAALFDFPVGLFGLFIGIPGLIGGIIARVTAQNLEANPEAAPDVQTMLKAVQPEFHPKGTIRLSLDLREASEATEPERSTTSPYSGASKRYYRHRWLRIAGPLADGRPFALEATTLAKTKSGATIRTTLQVRGRLAVGRGGLDGPRCFGPLTAMGVKRNGRPEVIFWGEVGDMDDFVPALRELGEAIAKG